MAVIKNNITLSLGNCVKDASFTFGEQFLSMFYILWPLDHIKEDINQVQNYEVQLIPAIGLLIIIEQIIRFIKRQDLTRFQDIVINTGASFIFTLTRSLLLGVLANVFSLIYNNYRIIDLPLFSIWTWITSLLLVEFIYYWTHRAMHEINILWASHQFHHMAEDINITTTIRDSVIDLILYDIFPLPLAFIVPPPILLVHLQFSLIYQIWLHNEVIGSLGPIEYIINTPRQHRVHHGKNPYCIDKNYGALLMIWDRIFGTYENEKSKIIYGVVSGTPKTFDLVTLHSGYYMDVIRKFKTVKGISNKISVLFKGPGWEPGKPRLGLIQDIPEPDLNAYKYSYDPFIPYWKKLYVLIHLAILFLQFTQLADHPTIRYSPLKGIILISYIIIYFTSFGAIFDSRRFAALLEIVRCLTYFLLDYYLVESVDWGFHKSDHIIIGSTLWIMRITHILSILIWVLYIFGAEPTKNKKTMIFRNVEKINLSDKLSAYFTWRCFFVITLMILLLVLVLAYMYKIYSCNEFLILITN